jgi:hypothetical protein
LLSTPTPYPHVGAWAVYVQDGTPVAARILSRGADSALISIAGRFAATASKTVPVADLRDPTPLADDERAAKDAAERRIAGKARPRKADVELFDALSDREQYAAELARLLAAAAPKAAA